ncbi:MAG TPA: hypothetical protein VFF12_05030 [Myxococcaceae bacterium]|nr:hypothetical protein [Myxococcaceae bacterium]
MQAKSMSPSNPGQRAASSRRWALVLVPLAAVLVLGSATKLFAKETRPSASAVAPEHIQPVAPEPAFGHIANADQDVGPGAAESMLAQHPASSH